MNTIVNGYTGCKIEHKFDPNINKLHPKLFAKILIHTFKDIRLIEDLIQSIRETLNNQAFVWFSNREYDWGDYNQANVRDKMFLGKFDERRGTSYSYYAPQLYSTAQYLNTPMKEEDIVRYIATHF